MGKEALSRQNYESDANTILQPAIKRHLLQGAVVGILNGDDQQIFCVGTGVEDHGLFEIGSVTKLFTGLLLSILVDRGLIALEDPIYSFLPPGFSTASRQHPIRILDLAIHTSGLSLLPDDVGRMRRRIDDPYAGYTFDDFYRYLARVSLERPIPTTYRYSNQGYALLADIMHKTTGISFPQLISQEILKPLKMLDTFVEVPEEQEHRVLPGYTQLGRPAIHWRSEVFAGCGGICSTAADCLRFLQLFLAPPPEWRGIVENMLVPRVQTGLSIEEDQTALSWKINSSTGWYWHDGVTGGHTAHLAFHPQRRVGIVILTNRYAISLMKDFARHMHRVLEGSPAEPMTGFYELPRAIANQAVIEFAQLPFWVRSGAAAATASGLLAALLHELPR